MSEHPAPASGRGKAAAVLVLVVLVGGGLWLASRLGSASAVQDCIATGRHDCTSP